MSDDVLHLKSTVIGDVSIGATAQDGEIRLIVTTTIGNKRCTVAPETVRRFIGVLERAVQDAERQQLATQDRA